MRSRAPLSAAVLACTLAAAAPALARTGDPGHPPTGRPGGHARPAGQADPADPGHRVPQSVNARQHHPTQTSDGEPGAIAPVIPTYARESTTTDDLVRRTVAPGVTWTRWDQHDARGPVRAYLLTVDTRRPGVSLDVATSGKVREVDTVKDMVDRTHAVAGVNGDFYDIGDTGAPLGVARQRHAGLLNARKAGWNSAFYMTRDGRPEMGTLALQARVRQHPDLPITNLNSPFVQPGGVGVYTSRWGRTAGYRVTDGQRKHVRMVVVRGGRVSSSRTRLTKDRPIEDTVLIGRGAGAQALRAMPVGSRADVHWRLPRQPAMALTGSRFLVKDGLINVVDDREMQPRTAVGIDRETGEVLILAVDGRQSSSRGCTMVEMANLMIDLGADDALNLDGGGSTTMVLHRPGTSSRVVNSPSDGFQRRVANALEVRYAAPR